jgi:cholesterol oxidase
VVGDHRLGGRAGSFIDQAKRMLGVVRVPYMDAQVDRLCRDVAAEMGVPKSHSRAPVRVYFGTPGVEADDPYFGGVGPKRLGCVSCGNCMVGCGAGLDIIDYKFDRECCAGVYS